MALPRPRSSIMVALGIVSTAVLTSGLGGCGKPTTPVANPAPVEASVGKPLTDEECLAVAESISDAVSSGDAAALDRIIDWNSVSQRCTAGIDAPSQFRQGFINGLEQARLQGKGISSGIAEAVQNGGSYTLLHSHTRENRRWLMFRLQLPESGLNYHDFLLARRPDGSVKAVDLYIYLSGELVSQTFRRPYIQAVAQNSGGLVDRLTGADQKYVKFFKKLGEMSEAGRNGQYREVIDIYKSFPPELKKEKTVLLLRLYAAQNLNDDGEYAQSIEDYRSEYPKDPSIDIISIDYYLLKKQYGESLACIDRLDLAIEGDPYLQTLRAGIHGEQNDLVAARADLKKAFDADPELVDAYWSLVTISLKDNNYDETLKTLRLIRDKFQIEISNLTTEPLYKGFTESPQYQEWLKDTPTAAEKTDGKGSAEKPKQ